MIRIPRTPADAPDFLDAVERLLTGVAATPRPPQVCVVRIDSWFDAKWLKFSGKLLGAVGMSADDVTVPPFHPHRVQAESWCRLDESAAEYVPDPRPHPTLHVPQPSERNLRRKLRVVAPDTMCVWYSGDSALLERGSLMVYVPAADGTYWCWFATLAAAKPQWRPTRLAGISPSELQLLGGRAGPSRAAV